MDPNCNCVICTAIKEVGKECGEEMQYLCEAVAYAYINTQLSDAPAYTDNTLHALDNYTLALRESKKVTTEILEKNVNKIISAIKIGMRQVDDNFQNVSKSIKH